MKILHTGDLHIREKNIDEIEKVLNFMVSTASADGLDLVVIAGDTFDSRDIKLDSKAAKLAVRIISELADIAPVAVVVGTPSHDGTAPEILQYARGKHPVHVATRPEQVTLAGAVLTLIPTPTKQHFNQGTIQSSNEDIARGMAGMFAGYGVQASRRGSDPHILVGHWNVAGSMLSTGQMLTGHDIDISVDQMMLAEPDLIMLGHIHMPQKLGDRAYYCGSPYPLTWGETELKGFYLHTLKGRALVSSEFIETPCRKLKRYAVDLTGGGVLDDLSLAFIGDDKGAYVRADITTWQDEASMISKDGIRDHFLNAGALDVDIRIIRKPRETVRSEVVLKAATLRDKLVAMAALNEETVSESILSKADALENTEPAKLLEVA